MARIEINNLGVQFKVYGSTSRSLKNRIFTRATGGRISAGEDDSIKVRALDGVTLTISNGDRIGLVGHNGAGKSTLLRAISGLYRPTVGEIIVEGTVGTLIDPSAGLDPEATGFQNIYLRGYVLGMTKREITARIDDIATFTELGEFLNLRVKTYSAGMLSRLSFAISSSIEPEILLIDEAIGAGDAAFQDRVKHRLDHLMKRSAILVMATHSFDLLERFCTSAALFKSGQLLEVGPIDQIKNRYLSGPN